MITLNMPAEIRQYVLQFQGEMKASKGLGHYSQQQAILSIIREHKEHSEATALSRRDSSEKAQP